MINLITQVNTDQDSMEVFKTPVGHTSTDGLVIMHDMAVTMGLTQVHLLNQAGNDEAIGDYTAMLTGVHPDGYEVELYVQTLQNLDG